MPAVEIFVRRLSNRVMAARKHDGFMLKLVTLELGEHLPREFWQESQVVAGVNDQ